MRTWAVDTIYYHAEVQFDEFAKKLLIDGEYRFTLTRAEQVFQKSRGQLPEDLSPLRLEEELSKF